MTESIRQSGIADVGAVVAWGFRIVWIWLFPQGEGVLSRYYARYSGPDRGFGLSDGASPHIATGTRKTNSVFPCSPQKNATIPLFSAPRLGWMKWFVFS